MQTRAIDIPHGPTIVVRPLRERGRRDGRGRLRPARGRVAPPPLQRGEAVPLRRGARPSSPPSTRATTRSSRTSSATPSRRASRSSSGRPGHSAEIAFVVADRYQQRGIGSALTRLLLDDARAAGITEITALATGDNRAALALIRRVACHQRDPARRPRAVDPRRHRVDRGRFRRYERARRAVAARRRRRRRPRPVGEDDQPAVRARAADDRLRPALGARRGRVPLRHGRQPLPRHARRLRDVQRRPQQPRASARRSIEALDLDTPGMLAIGVTALPGLLAEALLARTPPRLERCLFTSTRHRVDRGGAQARPRRDEALARRLDRPRLPRADARLAVGERRRGVHRPLRAAPPRLRPRAVRRPRRARARAEARGRRGVHRRADPGQGRQRSRPPATSRARRSSAAATARSSASTRCRPASAAPGGCSRSSTGGSSPTWCRSRSRSPAATSRSARCSCRARCTTRSSTRWSTRLARLDVRAERARDGRRPRDAARARRRAARRALRAPRRAAARAHAAARRASSTSSATCAGSASCGRSSSGSTAIDVPHARARAAPGSSRSSSSCRSSPTTAS